MPDKSEKQRRKQIVHSLRDESRRKTVERFPASAAVLKALFDALDDKLSESECDDSLRLTRGIISEKNLDEAPILNWLETNGGHCDCEVLNLEPIVEDVVPDYLSL